MLIRRVAEHMKAQNWTVVSLDFVLVVLGVFVGIQAANWNDEYQARERRTIALDRLHSEAEASVAYLRLVLQSFQRSTKARAFVLSSVTNGSIADIAQEEMVQAVNYLAFYPPATPPRSVYDELIAAGQYSEIGDMDVRAAINSYYSALANLNSLLSYGRTSTQQWDLWAHIAVSKEFNPEDTTTQTRTVVDIEMALDDPIFLKSLQMGHGAQVLMMGTWEQTLAVAESMCNEIARYLKRTCDSSETELPADKQG